MSVLLAALNGVLQLLVSTSGGVGDNLGPASRLVGQVQLILSVDGLDVDLLGEVTTEVHGVDNNLLDVGLSAQADNDPVVVVTTRTGGLPTVTHVHTTARQQDVGGGREVLVGAVDSDTTVADSSGVNDGTLSGLGGDDLTVATETGNTTVGVHSEANVGVVLLGQTGVTDEEELLVGTSLDLVDNRLPLLDLVTVEVLASLNGDLGGAVTLEVVSVNLNTNDLSQGNTHLEGDPVSTSGVVTAGLPAVEPLTGGDKLGQVLDSLAGLDQVGSLSEELVGAVKDLTANGQADDVGVLVNNLLLELFNRNSLARHFD